MDIRIHVGHRQLPSESNPDSVSLSAACSGRADGPSSRSAITGKSQFVGGAKGYFELENSRALMPSLGTDRTESIV